MIQKYLTYEELEKFLDNLDYEHPVKEIERIIYNAYRDKPTSRKKGVLRKRNDIERTRFRRKQVVFTGFRKHSNNDVCLYARSKKSELSKILANLKSLIDSPNRGINPEIRTIAFKIRDHLRLENLRLSNEEDMENNIIEIDNQIKNFKKVKSDVESLQTDVNDNAIKTSNNLEKIERVKGDIMKEAVAISSVIVTIMGFFLTNAGILRALGEGEFIRSGTNVLLLLIKVNASMALGISLLMMISASFIHKGSFKRNEKNREGQSEKKNAEENYFLESTQFKISSTIIWVSLCVLVLAVFATPLLNFANPEEEQRQLRCTIYDEPNGIFDCEYVY